MPKRKRWPGKLTRRWFAWRGWTTRAPWGALQQLGEALAYTDRYPEAAKLFQDAIAKEASSATAGQGNPFQLWYAFACVAAAANRPDEAVQYLQEAVHRGYKYADALMADNDLKNLRGNQRFQELVAQLRQTPQGSPDGNPRAPR